ncbi:ATP-binding protein [uncultured Parasutterella sp.]|uniref:ATP-binding protein n=1 Tax=uncultured Parasutterella sp. TaxID=1263098 RepID=UPI0025B63573|nr:ATP-binding protein [uncultured Parasutterella sp.]
MPDMMNLLDGSERFTLQRVQIMNWGTFNGCHDIPVSPKGHLFVGASGSGKSTLLDAMSSLLSPRASYFNAAARQGEKKGDRNYVSYIRGAWSSEKDTDGRAVSRFLREGPTFSAVSMTFKSNFNREISLLFIGMLPGKSRDESAVKKRYFVITEPFDLIKLKDFGVKGFDIRLVKERFPSAKNFNRFSAYADHFMGLMNIKSAKVLDLLHKAQSAKNMGDINLFFRDFMLGEPQTFAIADNLVENFSKLKSAYETVKDARAQLEVLSEAKTAYDVAQLAKQKRAELEELDAEVEQWRLSYLKRFCEDQLPEAQKQLANVCQLLTNAQNKEENCRNSIDSFKQQLYESGGAALERLKKEKEQVTKDLNKAERSWDRVAPLVELLGFSRPRAVSGWNNICNEARLRKDTAAGALAPLKTQEEDIVFELRVKADEFNKLREEILAMKNTHSNLHPDLLRVRNKISEALGLSSEELPFAGELMEVKESEAHWQGAVERVLRQFSTSMLVKDRNYGDLARYVDQTHLGTKLVYHRVDSRRLPIKNLSSNCLPNKLNIKPGSWSRWMEDELSQRFDYECVDSTAQFAGSKKAVTPAGQIKHNETRHEKNDRKSVDDRREWVTGFSNELKIQELENRADALSEVIAAKEKAKKEVSQKQQQLNNEISACQRILEIEWTDIDVGSLKARDAQIAQEIDAIESNNTQIKQLNEQIKKLSSDLIGYVEEVIELSEKKGSLNSKAEEIKAELEDAKKQLAAYTPKLELHAKLNAIYAEKSDKPIRKSDLAQIARFLRSYLANGKDEQYKKRVDNENKVLDRFTFFIRSWSKETTDLDASLLSAPEFFKKLEVLEKEGLPKYEDRFRDILENSTKQNLINLFHEIDEERRDIKSRMREVNESLADAVFNRSAEGSTHLIIDVKDLKLPEFEAFKKEQNEIIAADTQNMTLDNAESYYHKLESLVSRISGQDKEFAGWRERVLDARQHVSFQGREVNEQDETLDIYDSGSGKSGGQRQKLTLTCLLAALRYQLGSRKSDEPSFAPVIMDEAFDKADSEFTDISLQLFSDFGFQPIVATPLKGILTLEPYIGSFAYVDCKERKYSSAASIQLLTLKKMLRGETGDASS